MITSSTERLASYQVKTTTAQNERNGDLEISSPGAAPGAANMNPPESVGFSRGQQSLDHSVWYNGALTNRSSVILELSKPAGESKNSSPLVAPNWVPW
jgi:hypothetical protein